MNMEKEQNVRFSSKRKPKKDLGFGLIIASLFFLFNPDITVIDIIPDFIGYILLNAGLYMLADLNDHIDEAKKRFKLMIFVSIIKFVSVFFLFGLNDSYMLPYSMLLYPCVFGVIELYLLIPAYNNFFEGILYLSSRNDGEAAFLYQYPKEKEREERRRAKANAKATAKGKAVRKRRERVRIKNLTEIMRSSTIFFVVAKAFLSFLPEAAVLSEGTYDENSNAMHFYDYIGIFRFFAIAIMTVISVIWLVKMIKYLRLILSDKPLFAKLTSQYSTSVESNTGLFIRRRIGLGFFVLKVAAFFAVDFYIDYYNILPDILFPAIAIFALILLKRYISRKKLIMSISFLSVFGVISAWASYHNVYYNLVYQVFESIFRDTGAYSSFVMMCVSTAVEGIFFVVAFIFLARTLCDIIKGHCGYVGRDSETEFFKEQQVVLHRELVSTLKRTGVFACISAITAVVYEFFKQYQTGHSFLPSSFLNSNPILGSMIQNSLPRSIWFVDFLIALAFFISFASAISDIKYFVDQRYLLD